MSRDFILHLQQNFTVNGDSTDLKYDESILPRQGRGQVEADDTFRKSRLYTTERALRASVAQFKLATNVNKSTQENEYQGKGAPSESLVKTCFIIEFKSKQAKRGVEGVLGTLTTCHWHQLKRPLKEICSELLN